MAGRSGARISLSKPRPERASKLGWLRARFRGVGARTTLRPKFVAGNWKLHESGATARQLASAVVRGLGTEGRVRVALFPPLPYLALVGEVLRGSLVALGAQNLYPEPEGAFTGEVSPAMLRDVGCAYVILGHSERRRHPQLAESAAFLNRKGHAALTAGLHPILCLGETLEERQAGQTEAVLEAQLASGLAWLDPVRVARVVLAYEPVWAIGTGHSASLE